jgi:hypothetical protein
MARGFNTLDFGPPRTMASWAFTATVVPYMELESEKGVKQWAPTLSRLQYCAQAYQCEYREQLMQIRNNIILAHFDQPMGSRNLRIHTSLFVLS